MSSGSIELVNSLWEQPTSIHRPGSSINVFNSSGTPVPSFPQMPLRKAFPGRRVVRTIPQHHPSMDALEAWALRLGLGSVFGPLIPTEADRLRVLRLLYQYRHLNREDLTDLPCTDLITHRVRIKPDTKPASAKSQKRWPPHTEWWLRKLVQDGLEGGIYELTEPANGRLSQWNARAVMVDKVENPTPSDEPRMTFDYSRVTELLPGAHMELSSKVHDHLSNPRHGCLFTADLKHAYLTIPLHPDDRHYFAFTISGIGQCQPCRMQQGSKSAGFTMTELVYRAFGFIPPPKPEPSLLHSSSPDVPPPLTFYMDDFFGGFKDFEEQFAFLRDHFFPRVEWAKLLLSFKKLRLFANQIKALGVTHTVGGLVYILEERVNKVAKWPTPIDQTGVRAFLGTVGITRRWIKNFAELARPLSRLTGKVDWRWTESEQLSFDILKIKCATRSAMHGIDADLAIHFYTDASGYAGGLVITQFQNPVEVDTTSKNGEAVEVPILYDSFTFPGTRRKYPTYKRELYVIVSFVTKYDYLCKHPYNPAIIHTDHKPLTYFLNSDLHEGIYGHWADQLRRLNISIAYIPGHRNKVADALSRTLFKSPDCSEDAVTHGVQAELTRQGGHWVWKDGKGGFEEFLASLDESQRTEVLEKGTISQVPVFATTSGIGESWYDAYVASEWFGPIYKLLKGELSNPSAVLLDKAFNHQVIGDILWTYSRGTYLPCIPESKVLQVMKEVHDDSGHWAKTGTLARLKNNGYYWPKQSQDVECYIAGCLECARHGPATRSQPLHPIHVTFPFQLMGMDFVGPLDTCKSGAKYILNIVCYFSRFVIPFATRDANVESVLWCLKLVFAMYRKPYSFYCDRGQHFLNAELQEFLRLEGINITYSPSGASKSTGMVEVCNRLVEDVLRKHPQNSHLDWDQRLPGAAKAVNGRIVPHLGMSPTGILFGQIKEVSSTSTTLLALPGRNVESWVSELENPGRHVEMVRQYTQYLAEMHDAVAQASRRQKEAEARKYDKGVRRAVHEIGGTVMLFQKGTGKLQPRWRGPFKISNYGGSHGTSFTLKQLNGRGIKGTFHGDDLKAFIPRTGYLKGTPGAPTPNYQTIRAPKRAAPENPYM